MGIKDWWYKLKSSPIADVIKHKHRFVVIDTDTFKEKLSFQLSGINLFVVTGITIIVLILLTTVIIAFTPLREWIPGYTNTAAIEQTYDNAKRIDSLETQLESQEWLIATLQAVMRGETIGTIDSVKQHETAADTQATLAQQSVVYRRSIEDSILRAEVQRDDNRYQVKATASTPPSDSPSPSVHLFYPPLKGTVLTPHSTTHPGVDIASDGSRPVCAPYSGTVLFAGLTAEEGQMMTIQHPAGIVTIYRNCGTLLKRQGDVVRPGEPLAYATNGSHRLSAPHLHFELWIAGSVVNPEEYISF